MRNRGVRAAAIGTLRGLVSIRRHQAAVTKWLKRIRAAVFVGLGWAAAWAPVGVLAGLIVDPDESMDEMWVAIGAYPGFLCGVVFCAVRGVAKGRRRFDQLSISRVGAWGALSGMLVGALPFVALASKELSRRSGWLLATIVLVSFALLSAGSAAGSLALAKWWSRRDHSTAVRT